MARRKNNFGNAVLSFFEFILNPMNWMFIGGLILIVYLTVYEYKKCQAKAKKEGKHKTIMECIKDILPNLRNDLLKKLFVYGAIFLGGKVAAQLFGNAMKKYMSKEEIEEASEEAEEGGAEGVGEETAEGIAEGGAEGGAEAAEEAAAETAWEAGIEGGGEAAAEIIADFF